MISAYGAETSTRPPPRCVKVASFYALSSNRFSRCVDFDASRVCDKCALSDVPVAEIELHRIAPELKQPVTREDFDQSIGKLVGKTVSTVQAMLKTAGVAAEAVDTR